MILIRHVKNLEEIVKDRNLFLAFIKENFKKISLFEFGTQTSCEKINKQAVAGLVMLVNEPYCSEDGYQRCITLQHVPALGFKGLPILFTVYQDFCETVVNLKPSDLVIIQNFKVENLVSSSRSIGSNDFLFTTKMDSHPTKLTVFRSLDIQQDFSTPLVSQHCTPTQLSPKIQSSYKISSNKNLGDLEAKVNLDSPDLSMNNLLNDSFISSDETSDSFVSIKVSPQFFSQDETSDLVDAIIEHHSSDLLNANSTIQKPKANKFIGTKRKFSAISTKSDNFNNENNSILNAYQNFKHTDSKLTFTKLSDLKVGTRTNVFGLVIFSHLPKVTSINQYFLQLLLTDDTLDPLKGIYCNIYNRERLGLPLNSVGNCLAITDVDVVSYKQTKQIKCSKSSNWWMVKINSNGSFEVKPGTPSIHKNFDVTPMIMLHQKINGLDSFTESKHINFCQVSEDLQEFFTEVLVLGIFYFKDADYNVLIVTDGTVCSINSSQDLNLASATYCTVSYPYLAKFIDMLTYVRIERGDAYSTINITPLKFVRLRVSIVRQKELVFLELSPCTKCLSIVALYAEDKNVAEIKKRLGFEEKDKNLGEWVVVSVPGIDSTNREILEKQIFEEKQPLNEKQIVDEKPIVKPKSQPLYDLKFTGDLPCIKSTDFTNLLSDKSADRYICKLQANIVCIWPNSFSKGLSAHCGKCENEMDGFQLSPFTKGNVMCAGCKKEIPLKIRYIVLLYDKAYFPAIIVQENALKFFRVDCKVEELTNEICERTDLIHKNFFDKLSGSSVCEYSENRYTFFIQAVKIRNFDNQQDLFVYEICGTGLA